MQRISLGQVPSNAAIVGVKTCLSRGNPRKISSKVPSDNPSENLRAYPQKSGARTLAAGFATAIFAVICFGATANFSYAVAPKPTIKPQRLAVAASVPSAQPANSASLAAPASPPPKPVTKPQDIAVLDQRLDQLVYLPPVLQTQWQAYTGYRDVKAFAVSVSGLNARPVAAFSVAHKRVATAIDGALTACEATARELGRPDDCEIFAIGDYVVFGANASYDRQVIEAMESLKALGRAGRDDKGRISKF